MKKTIIAVVLAVVLLAGGLGGFASAQSNSHEPMKGDKLVGIGSLGSNVVPAGTYYAARWTYFSFTNPDCVSEITIERISIIRGDGTVVYEGPLLKQIVEDGEVVASSPITTLKPHEIRGINLQWFMPDPEDPDHQWMSRWEALLLPLASYTVEVFWTAPGKGLPLTGWAYKKTAMIDEEGIPIDLLTEVATQMVNMKQKLEPTD